MAEQPPGRLGIRLDASPGAPKRARQAITDFLTSSGRSAFSDDAALLVSELVTNAVQHGGDPIVVTATCSDRRLRVEVHDSNTELPTFGNPETRDEAGRGLWLVKLLATAWAIEPQAAGKRICFELTRA